MSVTLPLVSHDELEERLLAGCPIIDVRAPCEYLQGALPHSVNLPLMNDEERAAVGLTYKQKGQADAIELGHRLVSGALKSERIDSWMAYVGAHPEAVITCARGGLRSQLTQEWLASKGCLRPRIEGGYKAARRLFIGAFERFTETQKLIVVSGPTGSGKTQLIRSLEGVREMIDLEALACHRGSAFGGQSHQQPSQASFENELSLEMLRLLRRPHVQPVLIEDESRMIGKVSLPLSLFEKLCEAPMVVVEETLAFRVEQTFEEYVLRSELSQNDESRAHALMENYFFALSKISKRLGGLRSDEAKILMQEAWQQQLRGNGLDLHRAWIEYLLVNYYDPLYKRGFEQRLVEPLFRGTYPECQEFLGLTPPERVG